jgi:hypothetical protein
MDSSKVDVGNAYIMGDGCPDLESGTIVIALSQAEYEGQWLIKAINHSELVRVNADHLLLETSIGSAHAHHDACVAKQKEIQDEVNSLQKRLDVVLSDVDQMSQMADQHAQENGWCDQYDQFVADLNQKVTSFQLPVRTRDYEVRYTVTRRQVATVCVAVTASSEDEAVDSVDSYEIDSAINDLSNNEWDDESVDYEIEEVDEV